MSIFNRLKRVIRVFRSMSLWGAANRCVVKKDFSEAIIHLELLAKKYKPDTSENLLRASCYYFLKDLENASLFLCAASASLDVENYISNNNIQYLRSYMHVFSTQIQDKGGVVDCEIHPGEDCNFDNVSKTYSSIFIAE